MPTQKNIQKYWQVILVHVIRLVIRLVIYISYNVTAHNITVISHRDATPFRNGWTAWFTGLSGSGKSTLGRALGAYLVDVSVNFELIDGDEIRRDLCRDLGFSKEDRDENIRRIGYVAGLLNRHQIAVIVAAISPYRKAREAVREQIPQFLEIHMDCPLSTLAARDVKGLYRKAFAGEIQRFSGVSDTYEAPLSPDLYLNSGEQSEEECLSLIVSKLEELNWLPQRSQPDLNGILNQDIQPACWSASA